MQLDLRGALFAIRTYQTDSEHPDRYPVNASTICYDRLGAVPQ